MVIRVTQTTDTAVLDDLVVFIEEYPDLVFEQLESAVDEMEPQMLAELQVEPGPVKYPIQWTSERQRRAFFATDGFGKGIPTRRTNKVQQGWQGRIERSGDSFNYIVENTVSYARYVYGSLAQNVGAATRFQQQFHRNTGWPSATNTVARWLDELESEHRAKVAGIAEATFKRRAFTSRSKK